jgi:hypothetical protein
VGELWWILRPSFAQKWLLGGCWWVRIFLGFLELLTRESCQEEAVQSGKQELFWPWCW